MHHHTQQLWVPKWKENEEKEAHISPLLCGTLRATCITLSELIRRVFGLLFWGQQSTSLSPLSPFRSSGRRGAVWSPEEEVQLRELYLAHKDVEGMSP